MFDGLMQSMVRLRDTSLAVTVISPQLRHCSQRQHPRNDTRTHEFRQYSSKVTMSHTSLILLEVLGWRVRSTAFSRARTPPLRRP